jgi:hypothetical protein
LTPLAHQAIIAPVHRQDILQEIEDARRDLLAAIDGLTPEQMRVPGAAGIWSVKDVLAHVTAWESELVTALNQLDSQRAPRIIAIEDIYEWNEEQYHISARRPLEAIMSDFEGVHRMLLHMVGDLPERDLTDNRRFSWMQGEPLWYLIAEAAYWHEREHAQDIRTWRQQEGF